MLNIHSADEYSLCRFSLLFLSLKCGLQQRTACGKNRYLDLKEMVLEIQKMFNILDNFIYIYIYIGIYRTVLLFLMDEMEHFPQRIKQQ